MNNNAVQLTPSAWFLEEEKQTEQTLNHMRTTMGTFRTDSNTTYAWPEGYLAGLKAMQRKYDK